MTYDASVPLRLKSLQQWFGSIISRPINRFSEMEPLSPAGIPMEVEATEYILPSPTLAPHQRIQIYNQQYWWRLLNILQRCYPFLTRLFGYEEFNEKIGFPYLVKYHPKHWSLDHLGEYLPKWIDESYHESDRPLILNAARVDHAYSVAFTVRQHPSLELNSEFASQKLYLQPHGFLFKFDCDLFSCRKKFMEQEPEYWVENEFPPLPKDKTYYFILFRNRNNVIVWEDLCEGEYQLLSAFKEGATVEEACERLENIPDAFDNIQTWLQKWVKLLTLEK